MVIIIYSKQRYDFRNFIKKSNQLSEIKKTAKINFAVSFRIYLQTIPSVSFSRGGGGQLIPYAR